MELSISFAETLDKNIASQRYSRPFVASSSEGHDDSMVSINLDVAPPSCVALRRWDG
jgi:hypothetical protein